MINIKTYPTDDLFSEAVVSIKDVLALTPEDRLQLAKEHPNYYVVDVAITDSQDYDEGVFLEWLFNKKGELKSYYKKDIMSCRKKRGIPVEGEDGFVDLTPYGY